MQEQFIRTAMLMGEEAIQCLAHKRVAIFGIGGVGGHAAEVIARSGVGAIDLIDNDVVSVSNINRQIIATHDTVGQYKTQVMKQRILSIHPQCRVTTWECFYLPQEREKFPFAEYDYIVDAIDTVTAKLDLAVLGQELGIPVISSMGTGNKLEPSMLEVADLYETSVCPLAKVMRKECKARGIKALKVVYSKEVALTPQILPGMEQEMGQRRAIPGSTAFVPAAAGLLLGAEVVKDLALGRLEHKKC